MRNISERRQHLWWLTVAPSIWAMHLMLSYATAAIWCGKVAGRGGSLREAQVAIAVYSIVALLGIGVTGWAGYRRNSYADTASCDADTPEDRHRFLGFATLLLSALSAVATIYAGLVLFFFQSCT